MKFSLAFLSPVAIILLLFVSFDSCFCQYKIRGQIRGLKEMQGYNVLLLSTKDSSIQEGAFFIDEKFEIESAFSPVLLCISSMGYSDTTIGIEFVHQNETIDIDVELYLVSSTIHEAVIEKKIQIFYMENNNLIMNVDKTSLSMAGNAADVLNKSIRVKVDHENNVTVLGKGEAIVYLDNREIKSNELLEMISSEEIQKIEVITNPGAQYDAEAKAIVKIITKKKGALGFGAITNTSIGYNVFFQNEINLTLTQRVPKNSLYSFYSYKPQKLYSAEYYSRDYSKLPSAVNMENDFVNTTNFQGHRIKISDRYCFDSRHSLEIQTDVNIKIKQEQIDNRYFFIDPNPELHTVFFSWIDSDIKQNLMSGNLAYEYQIPETTTKFILSSDFLMYNSENTDLIYENTSNIDPPDINYSEDELRILSSRFDFTLPLLTSQQIMFGGKYVNAENVSNMKFNDLRYNYSYVENMASIYSAILFELSKSRFSIGVRCEYVSKKYSNSNIHNFDELYFFPDLSYEYEFSNSLKGSLSFTRNIIRPTYQNLNPMKHYIDTLSYSQGNPFLKPELSYSADLTLQYMEYASFNVNYSDMSNSIIVFAENDPENSSITNLTNRNISNQKSLSINALIPYQFSWLTIYAAFGYIYNAFTDESISEKPLAKPQMYLQTGYNFKFSKSFTADIIFQYITSGVMGVWYYNDIYSLDVSLQKSFFKNKFVLTFNYNDILNSSGMETSANYHDKYLSYKDYGSQSLIKLTLSYKFNVLKSKFERNKGIDSERNRINQN